MPKTVIGNTDLLFVSLSLQDSILVDFSDTFTHDKKLYYKMHIETDSIVYFDSYIHYNDGSYCFLDSCSDELQVKHLFGTNNLVPKKRYKNVCIFSGLNADCLLGVNYNSDDSIHMVSIELNRLSSSAIVLTGNSFCSALYFNDKNTIVAFQLFIKNRTKKYILQ